MVHPRRDLEQIDNPSCDSTFSTTLKFATASDHYELQRKLFRSSRRSPRFSTLVRFNESKHARFIFISILDKRMVLYGWKSRVSQIWYLKKHLLYAEYSLVHLGINATNMRTCVCRIEGSPGNRCCQYTDVFGRPHDMSFR